LSSLWFPPTFPPMLLKIFSFWKKYESETNLLMRFVIWISSSS
jgi:hypothetical protein